ncbi:MAG TPA: SIMPL domain-containing protein [Allosphingosinicella sp.]|nr:SIMPL domain-containing protein [Allosphingosinicella sp.]
MRNLILATLIGMAAVPAAPALAQADSAAALRGTRLDVVATGEVSRVPDIARISAGVVTTAPTATAALEQNARQMASVRAALRKAGIEERDIQTSSINLYPDYRQDERTGGTPQIIGYRASNELTVKFRDIASTGKILDALVAQGANQINGPMLSIDKPEAALDEARTKALTAARARADLYARALGKRVGRILSISEGGGGMPVPMPMMRMAAQGAVRDSTSIDPGEQSVSISLAVSFELE